MGGFVGFRILFDALNASICDEACALANRPVLSICNLFI